ncbi:hypothetical protein SCLARK_001456 [Spiroplasma clarkii]|uniref:Uncharacterized protein n=1 Tax=Spiroplasma clarkii TaxID=2139 RepID=A0A1Y0L1X2_9MOLU|nr:hypothetical protein [Spiroplasma clarkii]ARU91973.1 hypothetical protein SCLARK_001456 [Spiroplasma clarkii]ATX71313.1 hypothetical protein SCLAR_v1c10110 [Spiroplasma clarkii]
MYKLSSYKKSIKISLLVLMGLLIFFPISGIIFDATDRLMHYDYFKPTAAGPSLYTVDQLFAWMFVAFTNWYALYCVLYGIVFLGRLAFKNEKSEFEKYFFNIINLATYSVVVALVFWPDVFLQLVKGEGFIFTNSWMKNIVTVNIHLIAPAIVFVLLGFFAKYEKIDFKNYLIYKSYYVLILPMAWVIYGWIRLAIYVEVHGFAFDSGTLVWWNSYKVLNPYVNPGLAWSLLFVAIIVIYGIAIGVTQLCLLTKKLDSKKAANQGEKTIEQNSKSPT